MSLFSNAVTNLITGNNPLSNPLSPVEAFENPLDVPMRAITNAIMDAITVTPEEQKEIDKKKVEEDKKKEEEARKDKTEEQQRLAKVLEEQKKKAAGITGISDSIFTTAEESETTLTRKTVLDFERKAGAIRAIVEPMGRVLALAALVAEYARETGKQDNDVLNTSPELEVHVKGGNVEADINSELSDALDDHERLQQMVAEARERAVPGSRISVVEGNVELGLNPPGLESAVYNDIILLDPEERTVEVNVELNYDNGEKLNLSGWRAKLPPDAKFVLNSSEDQRREDQLQRGPSLLDGIRNT